MKTKLTLRIDEELISKAKKIADQNDTSVSKMVADFFSILEQSSGKFDKNLAPITTSLSGILKNRKITEQDYRSYLEAKYLE